MVPRSGARGGPGRDDGGGEDYAQDAVFSEAYWGSWPCFADRPARGSQPHDEGRTARQPTTMITERSQAGILSAAISPNISVARKSLMVTASSANHPVLHGCGSCRRRLSPRRERVTRCPYAACSAPVPGSGPSSDRPGEHESGLVVDTDGRTGFTGWLRYMMPGRLGYSRAARISVVRRRNRSKGPRRCRLSCCVLRLLIRRGPGVRSRCLACGAGQHVEMGNLGDLACSERAVVRNPHEPANSPRHSATKASSRPSPSSAR